MTLFKFLKKPIDIQFFTDNEAVFKFCRPQRAAHFAPEWWKKMPKRRSSDGGEQRAHNTFSTMRTCAGLADLYAKGFIQPFWSDFRVDIMPNGDFGYQFADGVSSVQEHVTDQMIGNPFLQTHTHLKMQNPWYCKEVTGTKILLLPPIWDGFGVEDICVPPGVVSFEHQWGLHVNMFFKRFSETKTYELSFKQPVAHFIPLSDRPVKLRYELVSSEECARLIAQSGLGFFFDNRAKRAAKLCPYA